MGISTYTEGQYRGKKQEKPKKRYDSFEEMNSFLSHKETSLDEASDAFINKLSESFHLRERLGIILNEDGSVPSTEGMPRMFIMGKGEDGKDSLMSFEQAGIEYGSRDFWKQAQLGKLYAYPAGERYPVQLNLSLHGTSPHVSVSGLLDSGRAVPENDMERPSFFQRILHSLNKNWASRDTREYYAREARAESDQALRDRLDAIAEQRGRGAGNEIKEVRSKEDELFNEAEKQEVLDRAKSLEASFEEKKNGLKTYRDLTAPEPVFDPEREKINDGPNLKPGLYTKADFNKLEKFDVRISDFKVGGEPLSEEAYMGLVASCSSSPEFVEEALKDSPDYDATMIKAMEGVGFSKEHVLKAMSASLTDWTYGDFMRVDGLRDGESNMFGSAVNNGRKKAIGLLQDYQNGVPGSKKALAEAMTNGMKHIAHPDSERTTPSERYFKQCRVMNSMAELMEKDPELKEIAIKECGLTENEYKSVRGMGVMDKADLKAAEAESAIAGSAAGKSGPLSAEQKKQYAADVIESRLLKERFAGEIRMDFNSPEIKAIESKAQDMMVNSAMNKLVVSKIQGDQWQADPASRPLPPKGLLYSDQMGPYRSCLYYGNLKVNRFAVELGEKGPGELRTLAESIVERQGLGDLSIDDLNKKLGGNELQGKKLINTAEKTAEALKAGKQHAAVKDDPELGGNLNINREAVKAGPNL